MQSRCSAHKGVKHEITIVWCIQLAQLALPLLAYLRTKLEATDTRHEALGLEVRYVGTNFQSDIVM